MTSEPPTAAEPEQTNPVRAARNRGKDRYGGATGRRIRAAFDLIRPKWIEHVASTADSDLRSHQITMTYAAFGIVLDDWIHADRGVVGAQYRRTTPLEVNANWFRFATWASSTVSRNIRNEAAPQRVDRLPYGLRVRLTPAVIHARAADGQRVSQALAWAQRLVFLSATFALIQLLELDDGEPFPPEHKYVDRVTDLGRWQGAGKIAPPIEFTEVHFEVTAIAFNYFRLAKEAPPTDHLLRARYVLLANTLLTAIEQHLVDDAVETTLDVTPNRALARLDHHVANLAELLLGVKQQVAALEFGFRGARARELTRELWARFMTDQVLVMALPTETLRLGRDIPPRMFGGALYPADLAGDLGTQPNGEPFDAADEPAMRELADLFRSFDRSASGRGAGARDWRRFDDRMSWAVTLLRSRQQDASLFWAPFNDEDVKRLRGDYLPVRHGDPSGFEVVAPLRGDAAFAKRHRSLVLNTFEERRPVGESARDAMRPNDAGPSSNVPAPATSSEA